MPTLAHVSDLHLGFPGAEQKAARLVDSLLDSRVDHVVITGDITHGGRLDEYETYLRHFDPLIRQERVTVIPGNHDRSGDDVADFLSDGHRVSVSSRDGLYLVRVDSTGPHNRKSFRCHGALCTQVLTQIDEALTKAPKNTVVAVLLHHHLLPLPVEGIGEWFANLFGWPHASELELGTELLRRVLGRCDLVLHGHRHIPRQFAIGGLRPLHIFNAGSTPELGAFRLFTHDDGRISAPKWHRVEAGRELQPEPMLTVCLA